MFEHREHALHTVEGVNARWRGQRRERRKAWGGAGERGGPEGYSSRRGLQFYFKISQLTNATCNMVKNSTHKCPDGTVPPCLGWA